MVESRSVVAWGRMIVIGHSKIFGGDGNVQYLDYDGSFMCVYISVKANEITYSHMRNLWSKIIP